MKTNILVQYEGDGYDGCIWEWNYFYIDKQGVFHDIQSSGCGGIDNLKAAQDMLDSDRPTRYVYDMSNEQEITAFCKESNAAHVTGVLQWFEDNNTGVEFFAICSACKEHIVSCDDICIEGTEIICSECYSIGECICCESHVGETEIVEVEPDEHYGFDYICSDCKECHDANRETEQLEDLRWQAFCTGKPDIFSDELRELWV
jgi:hypothetical protein